MIVADLVRAMRSIAPPEYAEPWDRVGLHVGSREQEISGPVMLTIDFTDAVLDEALAAGASAVVAYHPPIWDPIERLTGDEPGPARILEAARHGIAVYSPHTALDAAPGGVTDWLCEGLSGGTDSEPGQIKGDCRALVPHEQRARSEQIKLVTFLPEDSLDAVRNAVASSGAGIIGGYRVCSFAAPGTGTFLGDEGTDPAVGRSGVLESVPEVRLEMVCSRSALPLAVEALRTFHPYEEPPVDVYEMVPVPRRGIGAGRRLVLDSPATVRELGDRLKGWLDTARLRFALPGDDEPLTHIGVVPGAGESMAEQARAAGCTLFVTGEMRHHAIAAARCTGLGVLLAGHTNTERGYLPRLAERLGAELPGASVAVSHADADILHVL